MNELPTKPLLLSAPEYYINRETSWLEFNNRVLQEAYDPRTPLLERLKFLAIFSANLDEYFMVRVAALKEQVEALFNQRTPDGLTPQEQLQAIYTRLQPVVVRQHEYFEQEMRRRLADQGIYLLDYIDLDQEQRLYLRQYFEEHIFPVLTPLAVDPSHPFPFISNLSLNLAVIVQEETSGKEYFARLKVPNLLPRFLALPAGLSHPPAGQPALWSGVPLEQVIAHNLEPLFPGMHILEYHGFRVTRGAEAEVQQSEADDLLQAIEEVLRQRRFGGSVVRLEVQASMPVTVRARLMEELTIGEQDVYEVRGMLGQRDLIALWELPLPQFKDHPWSPVVPREFQEGEDQDNLFAVLDQRDLLVHHPYQSFAGTVQRFLTQASQDPEVLAIKMTLYRTSGDSPIVDALIRAAENGKQVAVLVELKARFDEENNILWARKLEKVGVHVVYGLLGLKTHTKIALVVRREKNRIRRYVHIGTGNYNPKTARLYTDLGLLSSQEDLGADLSDLFNYLTGYSRQQAYRKLLVAPMNLRERMLGLIDREATHSQGGKAGRIIAKMNSLVDPEVITHLYRASQAGVQIDLIVRGICCLRPGLAGVSENIRVVSVVGRFLEHSRVFYFYNQGQEEVFIGSADWMPRNLDRRVEAVVPVEDQRLSRDLQEIVGTMLADNRHAWDLQPDCTYTQRQPQEGERERSCQDQLMATARGGVGVGEWS